MSDHSPPLISVEEAIQRLRRALTPLPAEQVTLDAALGRVLAQRVEAPHPLPPFDHSAMDGFAVRAEDVAGADSQNPVELKVVGEAAAGHMDLPHIGEGQAARITTGAPLPPGADCVVPVEHTDQPGPMGGTELTGSVLIRESRQQGDYIRPAGLDVKTGQVLLESGHRLRSQDLGLLGALGLAEPLVRRRPKVAVLSTGDEVVEVDQALEPGRIRDANGLMIRAALTASGGVPLNLGIASDNPDSVRSRLEQALELEADLILSSAGVSMGAHDYVRLVVEEGGELAFWRVNIRPGKPLAFGQYRQVPFIGLPGNPVSAWVTFNVFVRPALAALQAEAASGPRCISAELVQAVASDGRESYLRVRLERKGDRVLARLTGSQDSAVLSSLTQADGLLVLPAGVGMMEAGQPAEVWLLGEAGLVEGMKEFD